MWAGIGLTLSLFVAATAWWRSRRAPSNYYETHVYGMTPSVHRRYAAVSLLFAAFFGAASFLPSVPAVPALAVYALVFIFYFSSFARGFSDEE